MTTGQVFGSAIFLGNHTSMYRRLELMKPCYKTVSLAGVI